MWWTVLYCFLDTLSMLICSNLTKASVPNVAFQYVGKYAYS